MRWYDWFLFVGPTVVLLPLAIWVTASGGEPAAIATTWFCWAGFTFIGARLAWSKLKGK